MERIVCDNCHHVTAQAALEILATDAERGLTTLEVRHRQERFGPNKITERRGRSPLVRFLLQFNQPMIYILLAATAVTFILGEWVDAGVIFAVIVVNAIVGFLQEAKALSAISALAKGLSSEATVVRDGSRQRIPAELLVPGDIVLLQSGDRVPADMRLLAVRELQIDESSLTGESLPIQKGSDVLPHGVGLADRSNMAFSSTLVTYGTGRGAVVAIGDNTEIGRISEMIATAETLETPLTVKIKRFTHLLLWAIMAMASLTFAVGLVRRQPLIDTFLAAIALAVGAIPEGLPAVVTIVLAIGVSRMAKRRVIIRHLPAVETLGSTTVVCSDKTGTLTQNQMTVQALFAGGKRYDLDGVGYAPEGNMTLDGKPVQRGENLALEELLTCGVLCNDSTLVQEGDVWKVHGDPTEGALLAAAWKVGLKPADLTLRSARIDTVPFESEHQYMAVLTKADNGTETILYVKGSLERILEKCVGALDAEGRHTLLDQARIEKQARDLASRGLRVLGFANKHLAVGSKAVGHEDVSELFFLGLQGMIDPPRPEAKGAVETCRRAGIAIKMITGDHVATASAIAGQLGILRPEGRALSGAELAAMPDPDLIESVEKIDVFARVTPADKLRLVEALQERGHVVAMTGDGVNDAPALRRADIGVAMALSGTEVAREAADMVITDDNFASIEAAVEEGRGVWDNLLKFFVWTLPTNGGEGLVILAAVLLGIALPILPVQILWINMVTAISLGLMLAFEPKERGIMERPPMSANASIFSGALIGRIILVSILLCIGSFSIFRWEISIGAGESAARTAAVAVYIFGEMFYLFNSRSLTRSAGSVGWFSNPWVWVGSAAMTALQAVFTYVPTMNKMFHSEAIGLGAWLRILLFSMLLFLLVEIEKWWRRRLNR